jgi:putative ABC transport system ATP-binding protein
MVIEPDVLLADEPTGNLDSVTGREIMEMLCRFNTDRGVTILMVTHDRAMAGYAGRTISFLDGRIEKDDLNGSAP